MIFGPIACFRRLGSRFLWSKSNPGTKKRKKMKKNEQTLGHIKNHENFKILFWSRESEKQIFTIFPDLFLRKNGM